MNINDLRSLYHRPIIFIYSYFRFFSSSSFPLFMVFSFFFLIIITREMLRLEIRNPPDIVDNVACQRHLSVGDLFFVPCIMQQRVSHA